jgi:hypothetical protein
LALINFEHNGSAYPQKIELDEAQELNEAPSSKGHLIMLKEIQNDYLEPQSISEQPTYEKQVQNKPTQPPSNADEVVLRRSS